MHPENEQLEPRELTQAEFEYLYQANVSQFLQWLGLHPEVEQGSYDRWHNRLDEGQFTIGWEYTSLSDRQRIAQAFQLPAELLEGGNMPARTTRIRRTSPIDTPWAETPTIEYKVTCTQRSNIDHKEGIEQVLKQYAQVLQKHIQYSCPHGGPKEPNTHLPDNTLEILFWSSPVQLSPHNFHENQVYFGIETNGNGQSDALRMTDECREIGQVYQDAQGKDVLQVVGNTLYVLFDLPHSEYHQTELLTAVMELYRSTLNPEEVEMRKKVTETKAQARVGEVLTLALSSIPDQELSTQRINLESYEHKVQTYQTEMMSYMRKLVQTRQKIAQLEASKGDPAKKVARELKSLKKIKGVEKLTTRMNVLRVMTDMIYIETDVAKYEIGKFALEFNQGELKIINQTRKVTYEIRSDRVLDHPHVRDGVPCWGNMAPVMEYAQSGETAMCVAMVLEYLRNYTSGDAWAPLDQWPVVGETSAPVVSGTPRLVGVGASPEAQHEFTLEPFIRMGLYAPALSGTTAAMLELPIQDLQLGNITEDEDENDDHEDSHEIEPGDYATEAQ